MWPSLLVAIVMIQWDVGRLRELVKCRANRDEVSRQAEPLVDARAVLVPGREVDEQVHVAATAHKVVVRVVGGHRLLERFGEQFVDVAWGLGRDDRARLAVVFAIGRRMTLLVDLMIEAMLYLLDVRAMHRLECARRNPPGVAAVGEDTQGRVGSELAVGALEPKLGDLSRVDIDRALVLAADDLAGVVRRPACCRLPGSGSCRRSRGVTPANGGARRCGRDDRG